MARRDSQRDTRPSSSPNTKHKSDLFLLISIPIQTVGGLEVGVKNKRGDNYRRFGHNQLIRLELKLFINKYLYCINSSIKSLPFTGRKFGEIEFSME